MKQKKSTWQDFTWLIIITFFVLGVIDFRFGILGFICMGAPLFHAAKGEGKIHCSKYCPRGSFLGKVIKHISLSNPFPERYRTKTIKHVLLGIMIVLLTFGLMHAGPNINAIGFVLFRFMLMSFIVGILLGVFFKPRTWCQICPMGHAAGLITRLSQTLEKA